MRTLLILVLPIASALSGCGHSRYHEDDRHYSSKRARVKAEARHVGYHVEHGVHKAGSKLHRFFRGD